MGLALPSDCCSRVDRPRSRGQSLRCAAGRALVCPQKLKDRDVVGYDLPMAELPEDVAIHRAERLVERIQKLLLDAKDPTQKQKAIAELRGLVDAAKKPKIDWPRVCWVYHPHVPWVKEWKKFMVDAVELDKDIVIAFEGKYPNAVALAEFLGFRWTLEISQELREMDASDWLIQRISDQLTRGGFRAGFHTVRNALYRKRRRRSQ